MANESNTNNSEIKEFFVAHGSKVIAALVVIMVIVVGVVQFRDYRKAAAAEQAELLGPGMTLLYANQNDSAFVEFESKINSGKLSGVALAKAALYAGNIKYQAGDFDAAAVFFQKSLDNAGSVALVRSAAMHGLASVKIEKADYSAAAGLLEKYISEFAKRTGDQEDRFQKDEPVDEVRLLTPCGSSLLFTNSSVLPTRPSRLQNAFSRSTVTTRLTQTRPRSSLLCNLKMCPCGA